MFLLQTVLVPVVSFLLTLCLCFDGWITRCNGFVPLSPPRFVVLSNTGSTVMQRRNMQQQQQQLAMSQTDNESKPFAVVVKAEIQPDRMAEFLELIEKNAIETRKEPNCIRFDVLRCQEAPNQFFFYELYKNMDAIEYHKQQPHYQLWANFKASGGTIDSITYKADGEFLP